MKALILGSLLILAAPVFAAQRLVPSQYETIQQAITAAANGDEVVISPGVYSGVNNRDISFQSKRITVRSIDPNDFAVVAATVIDVQGSADSQHQGFFFNGTEIASSVLSGLTIRGGYAASGGGILMQGPGPNGSSPRITNCIIASNKAICDGAGISVTRGSPIISNCYITNNSVVDNCSQGNGGGVFLYFSNTVLVNCTIRQNVARGKGGGIACTTNSKPIIAGCLIGENAASQGAGAWVDWNSIGTQFTNCTIVSNAASDFGGGIFTSAMSTTYPTLLRNSIVWGNTAVTDGPQFALGSAGILDIAFCAVQGGQSGVRGELGSLLNWGVGNVQSSVMVDLVTGRIGAGSACIDAGSNAAVTIGLTTDLDGLNRRLDDAGTPDTGSGSAPIVDIGAFEFSGLSEPPDSDEDGVPDYRDYCQWTVPGAAVDVWGCPALIAGDFDRNGDVGSDDLAFFKLCSAGPDVPRRGFPGCGGADFDADGDVDMNDFGMFQRCYSGTGVPAQVGCQ